MASIDIAKLLAGYDPTKNGYARGTDSTQSNGWYRTGPDGQIVTGDNGATAADPYGSGSGLESYLAQNGVGMWDPGNGSYNQAGMTNQQAFQGLFPNAEILGQGSINDAGYTPGGGQTQFFTTPNGATPDDAFRMANIYGKDLSTPNRGFLDQVRSHGYMIPLALATAGAGGFLGGAEAAGGAGAGVGGGGGFLPESASLAGPMSSATQFVNPATLAAEAGAPFSTTGALAATSPSASLLPGASQLLPMNAQPATWEDMFKKTPTTGNKLVDNLLSKAATTALQSGLATGAGAANQLTAGTGGDTTGADQQAADEARKQSLIDQINQMYTPENFTGEEDDLSKAIRGQSGDALKLGYEKAARATTFDAARRGNVGGSVMADNFSNLNRDNQLGATKIEDAVNSALAGLRSSRLASQGNAISLVNAGSGPEGVNAAATGIKNAIDSERAKPIPDITAGLFQNVALSNQAINTGNSAAQQNGYISSRTGGGSLFPLGKSSGYNVNV